MQVTVLIAVFIALLAGSAIESDSESIWLSYFDARRSLVLLAGSILIVWSLFRVVSKHVVRRMERTGVAGSGALRLPGRMEFLLRTVIVLVFAWQLTLGSWAKQVQVEWHLHRFILADEILLLVPFFVMIFLFWHSYYPVNRYVREYIVAGQLAEGMAARPVWSRRQYISFHVRGGLLIVLVPMLLIKGVLDLLDVAQRSWLSSAVWTDIAIQVVGLASVAAIFAVSPLFLRYIWLTRPLPPGPLRDRLETFCGRMKLRTRDLLLWDTHSAVANAAVMGIFSRIRYVLLSDAVIENMPDEQIEAVFGHEAGHVKHHHILFLVLFMAGAGSLVFVLGELGALALNHWFVPEVIRASWQGGLIGGWVLCLIVLCALSFGWVSRRFERQADVYGAMIVGTTSHSPGTDAEHTDRKDAIPVRRDGDCQDENPRSCLTPRGASIFSSALVRIALLNGISADAHSWRHSSIRSRVDFLQKLAISKRSLQRFGRIVLWIKIGIVLAVIAGGAGTGCLYWMSR